MVKNAGPSTCSISKILSATGSSAKDFFKFINDDPETKDSKEKCEQKTGQAD